MDFLTILVTSFVLSVDSFTISILSGNQDKKHYFPQVLKLPFSFSLAHVFFISFGWFLGFNLDKFFTAIDHWLAFLLLLFVGSKMLFGSLKKQNRKTNFFQKKKKENNISDNKNLFLICIATSIDAFALGLSFAFLGINILIPTLTVFIIIFLTSLLAIFLGKKINQKFSQKIEIFGGILLILIGIKILFEHLL